MLEECDEFEDEHLDDERYVTEETYEPVEAYAGTFLNAKTLVYVLTLFASAPAASAMHVPDDREHHGRWGIQLLWIILVLLLLCLAYAIGRRRGIQIQQGRQHQEALDRQDSPLLRAERHGSEIQQHESRIQQHGAEIQMMREEVNFLRQMRQEILGERATIQQERRGANVMAIMMDYNLHQIQFMMNRIDRLRSLIANHQMPCPLGDTILVQENLDGAQWHTDTECPILALNRTVIYELDHCEHCTARDLRMVQDPAFTGRY